LAAVIGVGVVTGLNGCANDVDTRQSVTAHQDKVVLNGITPDRLKAYAHANGISGKDALAHLDYAFRIKAQFDYERATEDGTYKTPSVEKLVRDLDKMVREQKGETAGGGESVGGGGQLIPDSISSTKLTTVTYLPGISFSGEPHVLPGESFVIQFDLYGISAYDNTMRQEPVPVPEPATIVLFALCGFTLVRGKVSGARSKVKE